MRIVRTLFGPFLAYFLTPAGLVLLGALDSSIVFFAPLGIDLALIIMTAQAPGMWWAYALAATGGVMLGSAATYWLGSTVGEKGLAGWVGEARLARVRARIGGKAAAGVAVLGIIPPPFPFTPFVLVSGAFQLAPWRFLGTLAIVRAIRFGAEAALAVRFGERITSWMESPGFVIVIAVFIAAAVMGTIVSAVRVFRPRRHV